MLLLRHGQTTWNAERRWQGWADAPLSPLGEQQARDAADHLRDAGLTRVCSSDLSRARRTAELLRGSLGIAEEVVVHAGMRERDVGAYSGRTNEELRVEYPDRFDPVTGRALSVVGGEEDDVLLARVTSSLLGLAARFPTDELLVVSHGGVIGTLERHLGLDRGASVPNLGGRWLTVDASSGTIAAGAAFTPVDAELLTAPATE